MPLSELLGEHGVDVADKQAVWDLLRRLPLVPQARVALWLEYASERGFEVTEDQRDALRA